MELLWYYKQDVAHKYHDGHIDLGIESNSGRNGAVFYESPFALGMEAISSQKTGDMTFPYPDKGEDGDNTSLRLGSRGVINPLFQYNELADPRTAGKSGHNFGRVYNKIIRPNNPIVFVQPGKPKFIGSEIFFGFGGAGNGDALRKAIGEKMIDENASPFQLSELLDTLAGKDSKSNPNPARFYDFEPDFNTVRVYTRALMDELMIRMGLGDIYSSKWLGPINSTEDIFTKFMEYYGFIDLALAVQGGTSPYPTQSAFLPFRVEKSTDASDSFNNNTGQSTLAGQVRGIGDQVKEVQFLTGGGAGADRDGMLSKAASGVTSLIGGIAGGLSEATEAIIKTGGNLLFPEIWKDSTYSKSLTLTIKLHAPYGNKICYYENVLFPLACWLALAMPRQTDNSVYISPPLVRLYSKGWFSCDMGLIESISIKRGSDRNDWTIERLPRTIELNITIKDLFGTMMMSISNSGKSDIRILHKRNTALRDYLNVIGGIDTFADAQLSTRISQRWQSVVKGWKQAIDPRRIVQNALSNPILGGPIRFTNNVMSFFK